MHPRFNTVHDGCRTIEQGFQDLITNKQRAAENRFLAADCALESPKDVFAYACNRIGDSLVRDGFKYAKSGPKSSRQAGDFSFEVSFSSDHYNVAGKHVALAVCGLVQSNHFKKWQKASALLNPTGFVVSGQLGYLTTEHLELQWELANPESRGAVIDGAVRAIREIAFPFFARFNDMPQLRLDLQHHRVPMMDIACTIDFLMCFGSRAEAIIAGRNFLQQRQDLIEPYRQELKLVRGREPLRVRGRGWANELANISRFYDLGDLAESQA
jgi:hypothetical protein